MSYRDWDKICPKDVNHPVIRSEKYDAYACLQCDVWLEEKCSLPGCEYFCQDRPEKPSGN